MLYTDKRVNTRPPQYYSPRLITVGKTITLVKGGGSEAYDESGLTYGWKS